MNASMLAELKKKQSGEGVDEPVPPLCDRCAELQQRKLRMSDAPMHAASDCAEYCG